MVRHTLIRQPDGRDVLCVQRYLTYVAPRDEPLYVEQFNTNLQEINNIFIYVKNVNIDDDVTSKML
jgi:hypothetical protein